MATTYTSTLDISVRKQHACLGCGSKYSYILARKIKGTGGTEEAAVQNAQKLAIDALENDVDQHACPVCGVFQPDMVAKTRKGRLGWGTALALVGLGVSLLLGIAQFLAISQAAMLGTGILFVAFLIMAWGSLFNPNRLPSNNVPMSEMNLHSGKLQLDERAQVAAPAAIDHYFAIGSLNLVSLAFVLAALVTVFTPILFSTLLGWPKNSAWAPEVVGPGDEACFYFRDKLTSCKSMWNGSASAKVANAEGNLPAALSARTKNSNWGNTISGKSVSNSSNHMFAYITIPPQPELAGKTLTLDVATNVNFPYKEGRSFSEQSSAFAEQTTLRLASPGAGTLYAQMFWGGHSIALALIALAWWLTSAACKQLKASALPTLVIPLQTPVPTSP
jgi:hypothetical protein